MALDLRRAASVAIVGVAAACGPSRPPSAAVVFDVRGTDVPAPVARRLGQALDGADLDRIQTIALDEVRRAFAPFRITIVDRDSAFWRVRVVHDVTPQTHATASVGESVALGPLGGGGFVDFAAVAVQVGRYAPPGAPRGAMIDAIGRGVGRVAAHELGHQILGPSSAHDDLDGHAYENGSPDRAAEYFGELRWTTWRARLVERLGAR